MFQGRAQQFDQEGLRRGVVRDQQRRTNQISPHHQNQNLNPHGRLLGWYEMLQVWFNEFSLLFRFNECGLVFIQQF